MTLAARSFELSSHLRLFEEVQDLEHQLTRSALAAVGSVRGEQAGQRGGTRGDSVRRPSDGHRIFLTPLRYCSIRTRGVAAMTPPTAHEAWQR
jgi:hypothetical protein